jgi:hypothetical protein
MCSMAADAACAAADRLMSHMRTWQRSRARPTKHFMYATTENLRQSTAAAACLGALG